MKTLRDIGLLFVRYGVQMLRNPVWLFGWPVYPLLYLVLFTPLLNHLSLGVAVTVGHQRLSSRDPLPGRHLPAGNGPGFGRYSS